MSDTDDQTAEARNSASQDALPAARIIHSDELFAGDRMIVIEHSGAQYRLMITRNDRLILQK